MAAPELKVFVSAATHDLKSYREAVKNTLLTANIFPVIQESFPPDHHELVEFLTHKIAECDAVICLVGLAYGAAPSQKGDLQKSYTQIEYDVATKLNKPVYVFLTKEKFIPDQEPNDSHDLLDLQKKHRGRLLQNHKCEWFSTVEELGEKIAHIARNISPHLPMFYLHPPSPPGYFVGRAEELNQLDDAIQKNSPSTIIVVGMGGQGKTTLVYQWLRQQKHLKFAAGFWCTAYRGGFSFDLFLDEMLQYLLGDKFDKREFPDVTIRSTKLLGLLQQRPILILIDGFERWFKGWHHSNIDPNPADTVEERTGYFAGLDNFLSQASGIYNGTHFILTTRAIPAALDNSEFTIVPVYEEPDKDLTLKGLDPDAALHLLQYFKVKGSENEIKEVAQSYGYHPLALTILGGLLNKKFGGRLDYLPEITSFDPKQSLFKLFDETRKNLPGGEPSDLLLRIASHCFEDPPLDALSMVIPNFVKQKLDLLEQIVTLADWNLVKWNGESQIVSIHPLVKQYFSGLVDKSESLSIHEKFSNWYSNQPIPENASTLEHVRPRILAIEHALNAENLQRSKDLIFLMINKNYPFIDWLSAWGHHTKGIELLGKLIDTAQPLMRAELLTAKAALLRKLGSLNEAHADLDIAISIFESSTQSLSEDQQSIMAGALNNRGNVRWQASRLAVAVEDFNRSYSILGQLPVDDPNRKVQTASVLMNRGITLREMGKFSEGLADCDQALQLYRILISEGMSDLEPTLVTALINRGNLQGDKLNHEAALKDFEEAIHICQKLIQADRKEMIPDEARARLNIAATLTDFGKNEEAIQEANHSISLLKNLINEGRRDLEPLLALSLLGRSLSYIQLQSWQDALDDCESAIELYNQMIQNGRDDLTGWYAHTLLNRSEVHYALGRYDVSEDDRSKGFELLRILIDRGEPETRVLYLKRSITTAKYLMPENAEEAIMILNRGISEAEKGISEEQAVEALQIEAKRAIIELQEVDPELKRQEPQDMVMRRLQKLIKNN